MQNARKRIKELRQKKGQSVRDINGMLELWERDLRIPPDDESKAYSTFFALHPDLQDAVNTETHGDITTREQVTTIAQRHAERMTLNWNEGSAGQPSRKRKRSEGATQDKDKDQADSSPITRKKRIIKIDPKIKCYNCGEPGHIKSDCLNLRASASDEQSKNAKAPP